MKTYTALEWCEIFGIELADNDGFALDVKTVKIPLEVFVDGIVSCTINPENKDKYSVLEKLF